MNWATDRQLLTPVFSQIISRDRFLVPMRLLHLQESKPKFS